MQNAMNTLAIGLFILCGGIIARYGIDYTAAAPMPAQITCGLAWCIGLILVSAGMWMPK